MFAIGLLRRFLYPILDPLVFVPNTFYTHNLSKYGLFQSLSQYGLFQNPGLHTCFGLNLNRGLNKTNVFASKPSFTQRAVLHKNHVIHKHHVLRKNHVCWACRAVCIALSMVAGGTRRRQLYFETRILKLRGCILRNPEELRDRTLPVSGGEWGRKNISHHVVPCTSMVCRIRMESSGCVAVSFSDLIFVRPQTKITKLTSLRTAPHILYNYLI